MKQNHRPQLILFLTFCSSIYWVIGNVVDVHKSNLLVLYELLWLPMLILLFAMPVFALWFWIKQKFNLGSLHFYSLLISLGTMAFLFTRG